VRSVAELWSGDPDGALRAAGVPVVIDEWNAAPDVLGAVKRAVDHGAAAGSYALTGSISGEVYPGRWQATGRVLDVQMATMTARETAGLAEAELFVERALRPPEEWVDEFGAAARVRIDLGDYLDMAALGGYPDALAAASPADARAWLGGYTRQLAEIDASKLGSRISVARLERYLRAAALTSGQAPTWETLGEAAGIDRQTAANYDRLLERLFIGWSAAPFLSNRLKRLTAAPKRFIADSGLMLALAGAGAADLVREPGLLGQALETFVANQLRAELGAAMRPPELTHLRDRGGEHEVDLVLEYPAGEVVGIEVKASKSPGARAHKHLSWLRDQLGDRFAAGFVLHTGDVAEEVGSRIWSMPIAALWHWHPARSGVDILSFEQEGASALGRTLATGGFQIFAGAVGLDRLTASAQQDPSRAKRIEAHRAELLRRGVIRPGPDSSTFVFVRNLIVGTASNAAELLFGGQLSGPATWRPVPPAG
jgi:predicted AAA+ superfamily ATPase